MNGKKRIALIIGTLAAAGSERQLYELAIRLNKDTFEVFVICLSDITDPFGERLKEHGISVHVIRKTMRYDFTMIFKVYSLIKNLRIDIVHSFLLDASFYGYFAGKMANIQSIISSNRGCFKERSRLRYWKHKVVLSRSDAVIVNSKATEGFTKEFYSLKGNNIHMIYNGIDVRNFSPDNAKAMQIKRELGLDKEKVIIGTAGRLYPIKNHAFLLNAAQTLISENENVFFLLIGEGPLMGQLIEQSRGLNIDQNFIFLGRKKNIADYLNILDIFVLTSESEALPNVILEAMSLEKPIVTFDVGGCAELVKDSVNGFLVPYMNHDIFCSKLRVLMDDADLRRRMGQEGKEIVLKDFSMDTMVKATESLYARLTQHR